MFHVEHSMRQKKMSKSRLKIKAWNLLSKIIRLKYSDENGYCSCVTCGITKHWTKLQAGHFIPKSKGNSVYFLEINIHPQCENCNVFNYGMLTEYAVFMTANYSRSEVDELYDTANKELKITVSDYENMIEKYKHRLKKLL